jgi:CRISPR-associated endonuclease Csy4
MHKYIDIKLFPDAENRSTLLMNAVYSKLHKALYDLSSTSIGVSFPEYNVTLGDVLRLHGSEIDLGALQGKNRLGGMAGYCRVSEILAVPDNVKYRTVSRQHVTMTLSKLNRLIKRGSIPEDEVKQYKAKMFTRGLDNPYLELQSGSNGQRHRRYIQFGDLCDVSTEGVFDQFGLSNTATVPWF